MAASGFAANGLNVGVRTNWVTANGFAASAHTPGNRACRILATGKISLVWQFYNFCNFKGFRKFGLSVVISGTLFLKVSLNFALRIADKRSEPQGERSPNRKLLEKTPSKILNEKNAGIVFSRTFTRNLLMNSEFLKKQSISYR